MKNLGFGLKLLPVAFALIFASVASAQATRTWVSGVGDDVNPCSRTAPCKTFAGAISKTAAGGEINCLDPGGFGSVTITKNMSIDCKGTLGSVLNSGTNGIVINAAGINVQLRNLVIQGAGTGTNGINIVAAANVHLQHIVIMGQTTNGILVNATATTNLTGDDVTVNRCPIGLNVGTTVGNAVADIAKSQFSGNTTGVQGRAGSIITIKDSVLSLNGGQGVLQSAGGSQINLVTSQLSSNATGVQSVAGSTIRIIGNAFVQNGTATNTAGGSILSDAKNTNAGNGVVGAVAALPAPIVF